MVAVTTHTVTLPFGSSTKYAADGASPSGPGETPRATNITKIHEICPRKQPEVSRRSCSRGAMFAKVLLSRGRSTISANAREGRLNEDR
jgi:hypothetical protein